MTLPGATITFHSVRTLLSAIVLWFATIGLAPLAVLASVLGLRDESGGVVQQWCMRSWARALCWAAGVKIVVHGAEHIAHGRGTVYASNHVSWYDVFAIASVLPRYTFVVKAELRKIPIFGWGAEGAGVVFLERENRKSAFASYEVVAEKIKQGLNVVVFPEGTRGHSYALRPFKKGPFVLAIAAGAPVVPIVVYGTREVMPKGAKLPRRTPASMTIGKPFRVETKRADGTKVSHQDASDAIMLRIAELLPEHLRGEFSDLESHRRRLEGVTVPLSRTAGEGQGEGLTAR